MTTDIASTGGALTVDEMKADLSLEQLRQLVGLVEYDAESDPFPVTGWDAIHFGNDGQSFTVNFPHPGFNADLDRLNTGIRDARDLADLRALA